MNPMRRLILAASQNQWMRQHAPRFGFMRRASARFLPGEDVQDAVTAARSLAANGIQSVLSHLGENIADRAEAAEVTRGFLELNDRIRATGIPAEITVKLTQLGLDLDPNLCYENLAMLIRNTPADKILWIDMEGSPYVGVSLQAYLYRTEKDLDTLIPEGAAIRLVKGAYNEPAEIAYPKKKDVDE